MIYTGKLEAFCEMGTEGIIWSLHLDGKVGYDGLFCLRKDDTLTITDNEGSVQWQGVIDYDHERSIIVQDKDYPGYFRESKHYYNHGIQKNVSVIQWQEWFNKGYRGTVWRNE